MAHNKNLSSKDLIRKGENLDVGGSKRRPERRTKILICYRCGSEGHREVDCMSKMPDGRRRSGDQRITCCRCGALGHEGKGLQDCATRSTCHAIWTQRSQVSSASSSSGMRVQQLPKTPPQEPTEDGQVLELKSGGKSKRYMLLCAKYRI